MSDMKSTRFPEPKRACMLSSPSDRSACDVRQPDDCHRSRGPDGFPSWACNRAIAAVVESILRIASRTFRRPDPLWFGLNDRLLADIGETRAEAEVEAARCVWRTPLGTMADRVISQDLAKPRLLSSRFD